MSVMENIVPGGRTLPEAAQARVAIIMRTKDRPLLLHRALASVAQQSYRNWRLYLVNDGGDMPALEDMLRLYRPIFGEKLVVLHHETSKGMEAASNAGLEQGREDFIVIHDDDDAWYPDFLAQTVAYLSDPRHAAFVAVTTQCVLIKERIVAGAVHELSREIRVADPCMTDFGQMLKMNEFAPICLLFRRSVMAEMGCFDAAMPVLGDWDFNLRLMRLGDIGHVRQPLACYHLRVRGTNSIYSNTVVDGGRELHHQYRLYNNAKLRESLRAYPELFGIVQTLMVEIQERTKALDARQQQVLELGIQLDRQQQEMLALLRTFGQGEKPIPCGQEL